MKNLCGNVSIEFLDKDTNAHQDKQRSVLVLGRKAATDAKKHYQVSCSLSSQILSPWLGDKVDYGKGMTYRPPTPSLCSLAGRYDSPIYAVVDFIPPSQGLRIVFCLLFPWYTFVNYQMTVRQPNFLHESYFAASVLAICFEEKPAVLRNTFCSLFVLKKIFLKISNYLDTV